ncbi:hypothetical protein [Dethiobacter alkaliphilus]|uniref:Uncharacterized protein n=1 Tax=Dethiobacter alkaliphilus AHT 1 TaxID=555088 RepID=C0GKP6_DETAL|nr:hypothetical protein [Dethiobacter alkaliphilus]EEG76068.1 hypothetical protein DealDRAFT_3055 [Dethiobacter alkaliphilus AHT 1]MCW3489795.1 hypothetical protein [Dethiobacter alkaliphilus]
MKKQNEEKKQAPAQDFTRKENLNRIRGTVEFIDPEQGPTNKGKVTGNRGNKK